MGRYTGPSCKICRRNGIKLFLKGEHCETAKCSLEKRNFPPGKRDVRLKKLSEYGRRLREKQKLRFFYGVGEKVIRSYFKKADRQKGVTGHNLLSIFERRLDNVFCRSSLARSRKEARQLIQHGHVLVNNKKVDIPSFITKEGDEITVRTRSQELFKPRYESIKWYLEIVGLDFKKVIQKINKIPKRY